MATFQQYKAEYEQLYDTCIIDPVRYSEMDAYINTIVNNKGKYDYVSLATNIPWYFISIIHCMEASLNFNTHLHNGDPLTARTVHVPAGRPATGDPPFTWEESAVDALTIEGFTLWDEWSVAGMLWCFEKYNGFGYRQYGIHSPYLWSYSSYYIKGKFTGDGHFDPNAVSKQCGAAVLLKRMNEKQIIQNGQTDLLTTIKSLGAQVIYDPQHHNDTAAQLQTLLNKDGQHLKVDGYAGRNTSDAFYAVTGNYLQGDPMHL